MVVVLGSIARTKTLLRKRSQPLTDVGVRHPQKKARRKNVNISRGATIKGRSCCAVSAESIDNSHPYVHVLAVARCVGAVETATALAATVEDNGARCTAIS